RVLSLRTVGHDALLAALAAEAEHLFVAVDVGEVQSRQLADAQARSVEQFEDGAVAADQQARFALLCWVAPAVGGGGGLRFGLAPGRWFDPGKLVQESILLFRGHHW